MMAAAGRMKPDWLIRNPKRSFDMNPRRNMMKWVMNVCSFWVKNGLKPMHLNSQNNIYLFIDYACFTLSRAFTVHSSCVPRWQETDNMWHIQPTCTFQVINVRYALYLNHFFHAWNEAAGESRQRKCRH